MPFLALGNADSKFTELEKLTWKLYMAVRVVLTTSWVEFIDKKEFAKTALNKNSEIFLVYVVALEITIAILIHLFKAPQV